MVAVNQYLVAVRAAPTAYSVLGGAGRSGASELEEPLVHRPVQLIAAVPVVRGRGDRRSHLSDEAIDAPYYAAPRR
jgi:hypothetical protein